MTTHRYLSDMKGNLKSCHFSLSESYFGIDCTSSSFAPILPNFYLLRKGVVRE